MLTKVLVKHDAYWYVLIVFPVNLHSAYFINLLHLVVY